MYKFNQNDIFYNTVKTYPSHTIMMYNNNLYINDQINEGSNKSSGSIKLAETNNTITADGTWIPKSFTYTGGAATITPVTFSQGQLTTTIARSFIRESSGYDFQYTTAKAPFKLLSMVNTLNYYKTLNPNYNSDNFLDQYPQNFNKSIPNYLPNGAYSPLQLLNPTGDLNIIEIPKIFYADSINPGSVDLQFYVTGTLTARAQDIKLNGDLIQTTGSTSGSIIGVILYNEGVIIISGSNSLNDGVLDWYIQPTASGGTPVYDNPKWTYFGSYKNVSGVAAKAIVSSSYVMSFEGTHTIPTLTMLAHANKNDLNWSNNSSYLQSGSYSTFLAVTSSTKYIENSELTIKNTVSSSFANYSASFYPQTFINTIGIYNEEGELIAIAKTANPVRKTNEQDYTFKLKIDL